MEFTVGNALGTGFRVWFRNFLPFTLLNALLHLPLLAWIASILQGTPSLEKAAEIQRWGLISGLIGFFLQMFLVSAVTYGVVQELRGQHAPFTSTLRVGLSRLLPSVGVTILLGLCVFAGVFALLVGAIIVYAMLYVAVPASVIEKPGLLGALHRSRELTKGYRLQIFGMLFLVWGAGLLINKGIENATIHSDASPDEIMSMVRQYVFAVSIVEIVTGVFGAVLAAVTYAQLRFSKEGTGADDLAKVFD